MEKFNIPEELIFELRVKYSSDELDDWFMLDNNVAIEQSLIRVELDDALRESDPPLNLGGKDYYTFCREKEGSGWVFVMSKDRNVISFLLDPKGNFDVQKEVISIRISKDHGYCEYRLRGQKTFKSVS